MVYRLAPQARAELGNIWNYIVNECGSVAAADGIIDAITERFLSALSVSSHGPRSR